MLNYIKFNYFYQLGGKKKLWETLEHNGVLFPPEYIKVDIPLIYDNKEIILNKEAEEAAFFYAKYLETEYIKISKFNKNFWKDLKKLINPQFNITDFDKCDFSLMKKYLDEQKEKRLNISKKTKEQNKIKRKENEKKYTIVKVNGKEQLVGNFRVEPPGLFLGRGCHPKTGKIKKRINPKDITINIGKEAEIPDTGFKNTNWGSIIHNKNSIWLASWKDNITGKTKYVWLSDTSDFKSESDIKKFDLAKKLRKKIKEIRNVNNEKLLSEDIKIKQLATVLYLIDNFAIRVGNEKSKNQADTVGVSSLRVEHIDFLDNNKIKLDFLGKDSVRYIKKTTIDKIIYDNLKLFCQNKNKKNQIFDKINTTDINQYLQTFMKNLTSKVFRTMNASYLFQKELNKLSKNIGNCDENCKLNILLDGINKANAKVALLCNHQKNISKNFKDQIKKIKIKIKESIEKRKITKNKLRKKKLKIKIIKLKSKLHTKLELKNLSLGTSKTNYIDPRITISFMKKFNIDINKLFTKNLQDKFTWAMKIEQDYQF